MNNLLIAFTIPNNINIEDTPAFQCYKKLINKPRYITIQGCSIGKNRNLAVTKSQKKIQTEFDFRKILFIDYDIEYDDSHINQLLEDDLPIVCKAYPKKNNSNKIHAGRWKKCIGDIDYYNADMIGSHECDWCSGGFLMIDKKVFTSLEYPYFEGYHFEYEGYADVTTEDIGFCIKAKNYGYKIYVDCDCPVKHINFIGGKMQEQKQNTEQQQNNTQYNVDIERLKVSDLFVEVQNIIANMRNVLSAKNKECEQLKAKIKEYETIKAGDKIK